MHFSKLLALCISFALYALEPSLQYMQHVEPSLKSPSQKYMSHTRSLFKLSRRIKSIMDLCSNNVPLLVCTFFYSLTLLCSFSSLLFECIQSERNKCGWHLGNTQIKYFTTKNSFCRTRKKARNAKKVGSEEWGLLVFVCLMAIGFFFTLIL